MYCHQMHYSSICEKFLFVEWDAAPTVLKSDTDIDFPPSVCVDKFYGK